MVPSFSILPEKPNFATEPADAPVGLRSAATMTLVSSTNLISPIMSYHWQYVYIKIEGSAFITLLLIK